MRNIKIKLDFLDALQNCGHYHYCDIIISTKCMKNIYEFLYLLIPDEENGCIFTSS